MVTEEWIGTITSVDPEHHEASLHIDHGLLHLGDEVHVRSIGVDFFEKVRRLHLPNRDVEEARAGADVRIPFEHALNALPAAIARKARVFIVRDPYRVEDGAPLARLFPPHVTFQYVGRSQENARFARA